MFAHDFVRNAYLAGTFIALACGAVGWFVVLRAQVFAGDALSHVAFVGAIAAVLAGLDARAGLFTLTLVVALALAVLGRRGQPDDVVIGVSFAWILGIGVLLITVLATSTGAGNGIVTVSTLFGSIYSLTGASAAIAAAIGFAVVVLLLLGFRPLLLATLDADLAVLRGLPVGLIGAGFLALLALVTAESAQAVGTLLLIGLLAAPAGTAHRLTSRPYRGVALAAGLAVLCTWAGLALSYAIPSLPPSSAIIGLAGGIYGVTLWATRRPRLRAAPRSG
jgi:zinc/manganese transport system permease protein